LLPQAVLDTPRLGCLNIHASLLPRWRGAAPIQRAILAGDSETGVTIMQMEAGLDTGPMIRKESTPIADKTAGMLTEELAGMGASLIVATLADTWVATPQPAAGVTLAHKISKIEARLDFSSSAEVLERAIRAFNPAPGAWCEIGSERIKILYARVDPGSLPAGITGAGLAIGTGKGVLQPLLVQRPGKPAMAARDLLNGWPIPPGTQVNPP
jgi:methionyl-tRNA formyltransferase